MTAYSRTPAQATTIRDLALQGFSIDQEERSQVRMVRGNDYRLVLMDGSQRRALGARSVFSRKGVAR